MKRMTRLALALCACLATVTHAQEKQTSPPGTVTLSLSEYERLLDRASKPPRQPEAPPFDAVVSRAEMRVRVDDDFARGVFRLEGEVFRKGPSRVLLIAGATLLETTLQTTTPPLALENGRHSAILVGPRSFDLDLAWAAPVTAEPGRASIVIPVPLAGSVGLTLDLPGEVRDVRVDPGLITKKITNAGRTLVEVSPDRTQMIRVSWAARATTTSPRESRFLSDIKTLVTVGETELRMAALIDISVVQGQPDRFEVILPAGFTLTSASGGTLESFSLPNGRVVLNLREVERRTHQVLLGLERQLPGVTFPMEIEAASLVGAQRETGEIAFEGVGALELLAEEKGVTRRMDTREANVALKSLAREPLLAALRYHARPGETVSVPIDVKRFPETLTLAAIADRAEATSLVTTEGRVLTEVTLTVRNHAQPFLRVALPAGAVVLSAEIEGVGVKPAFGEGGTRIPLLRTGFRPTGPYTVSFVYLQTADAFGKRGDGRLALPKLDIPVALFAWEVFLPDLLQVRDFAGNAARENIWGVSRMTAGRDGVILAVEGGVAGGVAGGVSLAPAAAEETSDAARRPDTQKIAAQSMNVMNLQRRVAGILPVRIDIPRAGRSYRFARPLVVDEETLLTFKYKAR